MNLRRRNEATPIQLKRSINMEWMDSRVRSPLKKPTKVQSVEDMYSVRNSSLLLLQGRPFKYVSNWKNIIIFFLNSTDVFDSFLSVEYYSYFVWFKMENLLIKGKKKKVKKYISNKNLNPQPRSLTFVKKYQEFKQKEALFPEAGGLDPLSEMVWNLRHDLDVTQIVDVVKGKKNQKEKERTDGIFEKNDQYLDLDIVMEEMLRFSPSRKVYEFYSRQGGCSNGLKMRDFERSRSLNI